MLVLDLCAGTGSSTQAFKDRGHVVETLDIEGNHTYVCDVRDFIPLKQYDFIWASPPCTCFSMAAVSKHWTNHQPNPETLEAIEIAKACVSIALTGKYHAIENPRAMMRTLIFMKELAKKEFRSLVTYCQYGDTSMKPTDIFHNIPSFHPKKCSNNSKCHTPSPRGTTLKGSTQWKSKKNRAKIPYVLSLEICKAVETDLNQ